MPREFYHWTDAKAAAQPLPDWLCLRLCYSTHHNQHHPQTPSQEATKNRAGATAAEAVQLMGGSLLAPMPVEVRSSKDWQAFTKAAAKLSAAQHRAFCVSLCTSHAATLPEAEGWKLHRCASALLLLMQDLDKQKQANTQKAPGSRRRTRKGLG